MPLPILPQYYYRDHFIEMLDEVERAYAPILTADHHDLVRQFRGLSQHGQCLYIRMANRRGAIFPHAALAYAEIDFNDAIAELRKQGFVRPVAADDLHALMAIQTKDVLLTLARQSGDAEFRASWPKARLAAHLGRTIGLEHLQDTIDVESHVVREHRKTLDYLLFLYFGRTFRDLKSFALRDLGVVAVNRSVSLSARFADATEAEACFHYATLRGALPGWSADEYERAATLLAIPPPTEYAAALHAKLAFDIGAYFEKSGAADRAIELYQLSKSPECNERRARLLYATGRVDEAKTLLERMIDDPASDGEHEFAADYYARKFDRQRVGACTALLRDSRRIILDETHRNSPEIGAASAFRREAWTPYWTENGFWHVLFGLLFWDELFGARATLHSGFDALPRCLADRSFHAIYAAQVAAKLSAIRSGTAAALVGMAFEAHAGTPNGLIAWEGFDIDPIVDCLHNAPPDAVANMVEAMTQDFHAYRDGFPDLMLTRAGEVRFVEVKAEGDVVRRNQLTRLRQLTRAGFDASICRVDYRYDPDQVYAVVDIETTGGRAASHRVIEIGAVKMRGHQVIGEWHSMLHPGCRIPKFITGLTGITDAMVADAPEFADIADDLAGFLQDSVFAAHNVNFDYGFLNHEYRRLERGFRYPKFCTCAGMRRHYPGHSSYSLGTLCKAFGITLDNHHRALDDARAAGGLLSLINRKREAA